VFSGMVIKGLTSFIEKKLGDAGVVSKLELDKNSRTIRLLLQLKGETEETTVELVGYSLATEGSQTRLGFEQVRVSRPWMQSLIDSYFPQPGVTIPEKYASMIGMLL
jgi:hypothetical protein